MSGQPHDRVRAHYESQPRVLPAWCAEVCSGVATDHQGPMGDIEMPVDQHHTRLAARKCQRTLTPPIVRSEAEHSELLPGCEPSVGPVDGIRAPDPRDAVPAFDDHLAGPQLPDADRMTIADRNPRDVDVVHVPAPVDGSGFSRMVTPPLVVVEMTKREGVTDIEKSVTRVPTETSYACGSVVPSESFCGFSGFRCSSMTWLQRSRRSVEIGFSGQYDGKAIALSAGRRRCKESSFSMVTSWR